MNLLQISLIISMISLITYTKFSSASLHNLFGIFQKNNKTRAESLTNMRSIGSLIISKIESKRCDDALCLECVPGFCRERLVQNPHSNQQTVTNGFPNLTISDLPTKRTQTKSFPQLNGTVLGSIAQNSMPVIAGATVPQNLNHLSDLFNSNINSIGSALNPVPLNSDNETTDSTQQIITSTSPPKMCMCSWIK